MKNVIMTVVSVALVSSVFACASTKPVEQAASDGANNTATAAGEAATATGEAAVDAAPAAAAEAVAQ